VKNFARLEPPRVASHDGDRFQSTYKRLHTEANTVMRHNAGGSHNNYFIEMCSGSEEGSYLRLIDLCITQL